MAVAFDAFTAGDTGVGSFTVSHTPVGTPRAAIALVKYTTLTGAVTYGGEVMTLVNGDALAGPSSANLAVYFLGSGVPTGAQDCANADSTGAHIGVITLTADSDTEVTAFADIPNAAASGDVTDTFDVGAVSAFVAELFAQNGNGIGNATPLAGWTDREETDEGAFTSGDYTLDALSTGVTTFGLNITNEEEVAVRAVAVAEVAAGGVVVGSGLTTGLKLERRRLAA
jgi:hypothetical protein